MIGVYDVIVIGGGPAGLAAAYSAWKSGAGKVLIVERDNELGGILNQCIHNGFGLHYFKEELTGPEYAGRFIKMLENTGISVLLDTMVLDINKNREVRVTGKKTGYLALKAKSIILAMGCRERTRGAIGIPGSRPAGIFTAGTAQRYVNIEGYMVGRRVVVLGSGDIGLIMARRMTLEGAKVLACVEIMPYSGGLTRNIVQCLNDYDIPLYLSHTITEIRGNLRVNQVTVSKVDENRAAIPGYEIIFDCDTVLLSVGLIPENELSLKAEIEIDPRTGGAAVYENAETSVPGIFACGNALHVHDLVDYVTEESEKAGNAAAAFAKSAQYKSSNIITIKTGGFIGYTVPQKIRYDVMGDSTDIFFRVNKVCRKSVINVMYGKNKLASYNRGHLAPGEMQRITLPQKLLKNVAGEITITAEEVLP